MSVCARCEAEGKGGEMGGGGEYEFKIFFSWCVLVCVVCVSACARACGCDRSKR